jgi:hypothetical protein
MRDGKQPVVCSEESGLCCAETVFELFIKTLSDITRHLRTDVARFRPIKETINGTIYCSLIFFFKFERVGIQRLHWVRSNFVKGYVQSLTRFKPDGLFRSAENIF